MEHGTIIQDEEILFRYAKKEAFPAGQTELPSSIFNDPELSCDWKKFRADPLTSFHLSEGKTSIVAITVSNDIRNPQNPKRIGQVVPDWHQEIIYAPISAEEDPLHGENKAHCLIKGKKKAAVLDAIRASSKLIHQ